MTAKAIRFCDFHEQRVADEAPCGFHDILDAAGNGVDRNNQSRDDDSLRRSVSRRVMIGIKRDAGVVPQNLNVPNAGNERVANDLCFDQRRFFGTSHSNPLRPAEDQLRTYVLYATQRFRECRAIPNRKRATYPLVSELTRASIGMTGILLPFVAWFRAVSRNVDAANLRMAGGRT